MPKLVLVSAHPKGNGTLYASLAAYAVWYDLEAGDVSLLAADFDPRLIDGLAEAAILLGMVVVLHLLERFPTGSFVHYLELEKVRKGRPGHYHIPDATPKCISRGRTLMLAKPLLSSRGLQHYQTNFRM